MSNPGNVTLGRFKPQFDQTYEAALCEKIKEMEAMLFGLTVTDIRRLAFDLAEALKLPHRFNKDSKLAGLDWLSGFLKRNPSISLRRPEGVSLSRAVGFNKEQVGRFFNCLRSVLTEQSFCGSRIWNMDETGVSCVQKPTKILAKKGKRGVGKITSAERGKNVTAICAFNAIGTYLPPMLIFPRKRWDPNLMRGAPPESIGSCTENGWTDDEQFIKWLTHFVTHAKPTKEEPHLIILDGHHSHKTLAAVEFCREHGIVLITLPPHCTHRLQPCDVTFFKPLKSAYNSFCDAWMASHPAQRITFFDISEIFGKAYNKTASVGSAVKGFATCGIWPFNDQLFSDEDFVAAQVTDEQNPTEAEISEGLRNPVVTSPTHTAMTLIGDEVEPQASSSNTQSFSVQSSPIPSTSVCHSKSLVEELCETPTSQVRRARVRRVEQSQVLTASPFKKKLVDKENAKQPLKRKIVNSSSRQDETRKKSSSKSSVNNDRKWTCNICHMDWNETQLDWFQCVACKMWACENCFGVTNCVKCM